MTWMLWRNRLVGLAMSLFVGWHAVSILVAPAPHGSRVIEWLHGLYRPYLTLFRLESSWGFFPNIPRVPHFRYVLEDAEGVQHTFVPINEIKWYVPWGNWVERTYWAILMSPTPERVGNYYVPILCRRHADLKPVWLTYYVVYGSEFSPSDVLAGRQPFDPEFVTVDALMYAECPK
jgi:hypothetical protein